MWLQLRHIAVAALVSSIAACSHGDGEVRGEVRGFTDETVAVVTPRVESSVDVAEELSVSPYWKADVITAATPVMAAPDAVTRATEYSEVRHEAGVGGEWGVEDVADLSGSYTLSVEPDYVSHTTSVSVARELLQRSATVGLGGKLGVDSVGSTDREAFDESLLRVGGQVRWSQIVNPVLLLHAVYTLDWLDGFQANPYRYVPVFADGATRPTLVIPERVPDSRMRHAVEGVGTWSITKRLFARAAYRLYVDDWGVESHTARLATWHVFFDELLRVRVRLRGYTQDRADFYRARYESQQPFRTGDYRLSAMSTLSGGARSDIRFDDVTSLGTLIFTASYDAMFFFLDDYPVFPSMLAHMAGIGVALEVR